VRILFDGEEVGRATAEAEVVANATGAAVLFGGVALPAGRATTTVEIDFVVPERPPGEYLVSAVGDTFTRECGPGNGGMFSVLAASAGRKGPDGGGGSLARTGVYIGLLVVLGLVLLLAGRALVEPARRRRTARSAGSSGRHLVSSDSAPRPPGP